MYIDFTFDKLDQLNKLSMQIKITGNRYNQKQVKERHYKWRINLKRNLVSKIIFSIVVVILIAFGLFQWQKGSRDRVATNQTSQTKSVTKSLPRKNHRTLVVYFSYSGTTKVAAKRIAKDLKVTDVIALQPKQAYPDDYSATASQAKSEVDNNTHPMLAKTDINLNVYHTIWLGFPTWFHRPAMIINSFADAYDLKGKTIIPFTTSASSSISESMPYLRKMFSNKGVRLKQGLTANSNSAIDGFVKKNQ